MKNKTVSVFFFLLIVNGNNISNDKLVSHFSEINRKDVSSLHMNKS